MKALLQAVTALALVAAVATPMHAIAQPAFPPSPYEGGPPPPPPQASGYVLEPGHWRWAPRLARYVWVQRHWILAQPGYAHFVPGHWAGGVWVPEHWRG